MKTFFLTVCIPTTIPIKYSLQTMKDAMLFLQKIWHSTFQKRGSLDIYIEGDFVNFKHSFLIRDPRKSIPSEWKAIVRSGFDYTRDGFGSGVKGFAKLYELFDFIRSTGREVTVIDAADLLKNPEYIMQVYCRQTGLPYDKKMLTWTPGKVEDWATKYKNYKEWHWNAMYSSGFGKLAPPRDTSQLPSIPEIIPAIVKENIQKSIPYYEAMHKFCVKVDS